MRLQNRIVVIVQSALEKAINIFVWILMIIDDFRLSRLNRNIKIEIKIIEITSRIPILCFKV